MTSEAHRSASIARHFTLVADLLKGKEHDRRSLAARLHIQPAMADRLLNAALEHVPNVVERREGKQRKIKMNAPAVGGEPSFPTALAACFGASLWRLFEGTSYEQGIREALFHVVGRTRRRALFKDIDRKFCFLPRGGEPALRDRAGLLDEVLDAVLHHHVIVIDYVRFTGAKEHVRIDPLSIAVHDHQLYVIGRTEGGVLHPYRFSRIRSVDVPGDAFPYPSRAEYDPEQVFRDSFGIFLDWPIEDVELRLDPRWTTYAETHRWHDSQQIEVDSKAVRVRLRVRVCPELEAWILGFGQEAEIVAPTSLRDRLSARREQALAKKAPRPPLKKGTPKAAVPTATKRRR